ncbi:hypothetical protein [Leptolyngbya ohadii]|uniref:hypothetical protein n=1 Tax=Leptolyngbya ohadii TaxID=1962290 RepID=UPI000B598A20|nr:hypothetical protein [Leptolyngbya ohadii]
MIQTSTRFVQLASVVTDRVAELLYAPVFVTNERGVIVTSSEPERIGRSIGWGGERALSHFLRIPLQHDTETGEVIVGKPANREMISPRLAQALVELVINQSTQRHLPSQHELKNELIDDLLHDRIEDETVIWNRAKRLGIDLSPPRAVILVDAARYILQPFTSLSVDSLEMEQRRAQAVISSIVSFFHLPNDTICAYLGEGEVAVLQSPVPGGSVAKGFEPFPSLATRWIWVRVSAIGWLIGTQIMIGLGGWLDPIVAQLVQLGGGEVFWLNVVKQPIALLGMGTAQSLLLRSLREQAIAGLPVYWIAASGIGGMVQGGAGSLFCAAFCPALTGQGGAILTTAIVYGVGWFGYSLITAALLSRLLFSRRF